jgi:hypothetical protein
VAVGEHLDLDVARTVERALEDHRRVAERGLRLGARAAQRGGEVGRPQHPPHAAPATAGAGLDHHRVADRFGAFGEQRLIAIVVAARECTARRRPAPGRLAAALSPIASIASGGGPTKTRPAARQARAKPAFSARKP